jgi:hypothetical protein
VKTQKKNSPPEKTPAIKGSTDKSAANSPAKILGGQPENDQDARDAGVESATSSRPKSKN